MEETKHKKADKNQILGFFLMELFLCFALFVVYESVLYDTWEKSVQITLMSEHKDNGEYYLFSENPQIAETFFCTVPELRQLKVEVEGRCLSDETDVVITLADADTGEIYYQKEDTADKLFQKKKARFSIKLNKKIRTAMGDTKNRYLTLTIQLINPGDTMIVLTSNPKPGIVRDVNSMTDEHSNVIYEMRYADNRELKSLFVIFGIALMLFVAISYVLLVIKNLSVHKTYIFLAFLLGMIAQCVIMVYGVPDEPWHMDTAYKYSNKILRIEDTGLPGTIYKRQCDIQMTDMLANGVESNSYYQLLHHTWERPSDTQLQIVSYTDTSNLVSDIIYYPTAIGISIGRALGLSALLTLMLGRGMNLLVFVLLTGAAIYIIPKGKYVLATVGMLPITMQQSASASYDPMVIGIVFLFIALWMHLLETEKKIVWKMVFIGLFVVLIAMTKGGVYLPVCLLGIPLLFQIGKKWKAKQENTDKAGLKKRKLIGISLCVIIFAAGAGVFVLKFTPTIKALLNGEAGTGAEAFFSLQYIVNHPVNVLRIVCNTFIQRSDVYISGMVGGLLAWHDIKISWVLILPLIFGLWFMANVETDKVILSAKGKLGMVFIFAMVLGLTLFSMLFSFTSVEAEWIQGVQGRYFLPVLPLLLFATQSRFLRINSNDARKVWFGMLFVECLIFLQFLIRI